MFNGLMNCANDEYLKTRLGHNPTLFYNHVEMGVVVSNSVAFTPQAESTKLTEAAPVILRKSLRESLFLFIIYLSFLNQTEACVIDIFKIRLAVEIEF